MKRALVILLFLMSACSSKTETVPLFIYDSSDANKNEFEKKIQLYDQDDYSLKTY